MQDKLPRGLYALVDDSLPFQAGPLALARAVLEGGAKVLQLRLKRTGDREALALIREVVALAEGQGARVIVNDRVDLALAGGAHGVHVGDDDLPPEVARRLLGPERLVGVTCRSLEDLERAKAAGADHAGLGPIFVTRTKVVDAPALGVDGFGAIARKSPLPVVGIAGITLATIGQVGRAGAHAAAVGSDLLAPGEPVSRVRALQAAFCEVQ